MVNQERCPTVLLTDTPSDVDAFGGHERVADSIAEVVQTEVGGRSIGLEGGWGSGKSTIVKLTSNRLGQMNGGDHRVAVFDIWAHQDDPLRRTFLESIITSVQKFSWVDRKIWDRKLAELTRRRREDTTRVVPKLTGAGIWFALILLTIPIGSALISAGATLWASANSSGMFSAVLLSVGVLAILLPALYYGAIAGLRQFGRNSKEQESEEEGLRELPALVTGQSSSESRTIVTQTPDPTSVEFEAVFRELLSEALEPANRKLLLVIDNLDRVQPSDALSIWSTLQTFLGQSDYQQADWIDRLWVLIPYDKGAILRLWENSESESTEDIEAALATSFLDKTFQLRFRVPPLLLSNWRGFLQEALQLALPNHEAADFHDVYRAFSIEGGLETSTPTPRDLKIFANQIGALHRTWQEDFPLSCLACYVLMQKKGQNIREVLLRDRNLELPRRIIGEQWRETIAAIHFGVPAQEARELLLRSPIEAALANGDGRILSELEAIHPAGFWAVLEDSVSASTVLWDIFGPTDIAKAATALTESQILHHTNRRPEAITLRESILAAATAVQAWGPFDATNARGLVNVGRMAGDSEEIITALLAAASNAAVEPTTGGRQDGVTPSVWVDSAFTLIKGLVELGFVKQLEKGFEIQLDAQQWLDVSQEVVKKDPVGEVLQYFHLEAVAEIDELLAQRIADNQLDDDTFCAIQSAMATNSGKGMGNASTAVYSRIRSEEQFQGIQLASMMMIIRSSKSADLITKDQIAELATSGHYLHHLYFAFNDSHPEAVGECMFGFLESVPDGSEPTRFGNSANGYQYLNQLLQGPETLPGTLEHFVDLVKETQQIPVVFEMAAADEEVSPFVAETLRVLLNCNSISISPDLVRMHWDVIEVVLDEEDESQSLEAFLKELTDIRLVVASAIDNGFETYDSRLYVALLNNDVDENFVNWCVHGLSSVDKETWLEELMSEGGEFVKLAIELRARRAGIALSVAYSDALAEYVRNVAEDPGDVLCDETWHELHGLLNADQKDIFSRRAYDILVDSNGEASEEFFILTGDVLSDRRLLANMHTFIDRVCRPILDARNAKGIEWIARITEDEPALITEHEDQPAVSDFKERIQQHIDDSQDDDATLPDANRIASALGLVVIDPEDQFEELDESDDSKENSP